MPLGISLDSNIFQAGSTLDGSVYFDISKEVAAKECVAVLKGYEHARVEYEEGTDANRRERTAMATRQLIEMALPIDDTMIIDGKIAAGKYQMKFKVDLPEGLPSSMEASGRSFSDRCSIEYEIRAQLKGSGWISDYKARQPVKIVAKPLQKEAIPFRAEPVQRNVRTFCCLTRGHILFGATIEDTLLDKGETAKISLACRNRSRVKVTNVQAILLENIEWTAEMKREFRSRTLVTVDFPQFSGMEQASGLSVTAQGDIQSMLKDLEDAKFSGTIVMPTDANDTFAGKLIQCRHTLRIVVHTGCCIDNPEIEIPIRVGPVPLHGRPPSQPSQHPPAGFTDGATVSNPIQMSSSNPPVIGGATQSGDNAVSEDQDVVISQFEPSPPSMERLFKDIDESIRDYDLVKERVNDRDWQDVFKSMTPDEYGRIIKNVDLDFDQPKLAECMAPAVGKFTCDYVVSGVRNASEWNRSTVCERVLPFVVDLAQNKGKILAILSDYEKNITERAFANALRN